MGRAGKTSTAKDAGLQTKILPILLNKQVGRKLGGSEERMQRIVDRHGLVDPLGIIGVVRRYLPTGVQLNQRKSVGQIPIDLVGGGENEYGVGTEASGRLQQIQGPIGVDGEVRDRFPCRPIMGGLGGGVDDETEIGAILLKDPCDPFPISDVDRQVGEILVGSFQFIGHPSS